MTLNVTDLQIAFHKWEKASEQVAHGENEVERERLQAIADKLAEPWRTEHPEDWQYLGQLREQWRTDPDRLREQIREASAAWWNRQPADDPEYHKGYRQLRHMSYTQHFYDPLEQEKNDWYDMRERRAELTAELAAARNAVETQRVEERIIELEETTNRPASWDALDEQARLDPEFGRDFSEMVDEHYLQIMEARAARPSSLAQEDDTEVEEPMEEETPWGA